MTGAQGAWPAAGAALLATGLVLSAAAQTLTNPVKKLDEIQTQMRDGRTQIDRYKRSADQLQREQEELRGRIIMAAGNAQARERDLGAVEQRLAGLETQEAAAVDRLQSEREKLGLLLAVLQRMGREPPPALIIRPDNATAAARSAMLLSAVVPGAQAKAKDLGQRLDALRSLRKQAAAERLEVAAAVGALEKDRNALTQLLSQRRSLMQDTLESLDATRERVQSLGEQAQDLKALLDSLRQEDSRPRIRGQGPAVINQIATVGASRAVPLDRLRGRLRWPANGQLVSRFGGPDGSGGHLRGIYLETLAGSTVTSPCDGKIMFAGAFRGYGQMLIISADGGYHVVLAGLTDINGVVGQVVLAGEPLGRMGTAGGARQASNSALRGPTGESSQRLYIEFRRNDAPVDPVPWFASLKERVSG
jgi:septal ring factor EnvC (AmiA/AmiB activator)